MIARVILIVTALFAVAAAAAAAKGSLKQRRQDAMEEYMAEKKASPCYPFQEMFMDKREECKGFKSRFHTRQQLDAEADARAPKIFRDSEEGRERYRDFVWNECCMYEALGFIDPDTKTVDGTEVVMKLDLIKDPDIRWKLSEAVDECVISGRKSLMLQVDCIARAQYQPCQTVKLRERVREMERLNDETE